MTDAFRAQLDALMGVDRNGDRARACAAAARLRHALTRCALRAAPAQGAAKKDYRDKSVCRLYLEGMCPCDLFVNTARAPASCPARPNQP
jgi:hypothetical protein